MIQYLMKKIIGLAATAVCIGAISSCAVSGNDPFEKNGTLTEKDNVFGKDIPEEELLPKMNINVDETLALSLEKATGENGYVDLSSFPSLREQGVVKMRRLFPYAGEYEDRTREAGLHRWYVLEYNPEKSMTKAADGLVIPGVNEVEYCPKLSIVGNPTVVSYADASTKAASGSYPFDDPQLSAQWHYYNNGTASSSVSGCDINVFPVWRNYSNYAQFTGDIVVGVVDGGIDYSHEDLKANMWKNPDKSGDNAYGYNFAASSYNIHAEDHGTHVAGTISAVNNNGKGVCGVAGGNSKKGVKGAKLMSCQIFDGEKQGSATEAIKWSADHGAVISQNSWGYTEVTTAPSSLKSAVDYFIKNAGCDKNGKQRSDSPMKGGIVIFAAGNDSKNTSSSDYDGMVSVTSVGADYKRAYYTNYGSWCDVAAPGGDVKKGNQVLSTLPGNKYGKMQGTSMACPHVSGIAALILARYGGPGYTPDALRKRLEESVTDISAQNAGYYLGRGLVNAYKAVAGSGGVAPEMPTGLSVSTQSNNIKFSVAVPEDADDGKPSAIFIYYSKTNFTSTKNVMFGMFYVENQKVGEVLSGSITGAEFNTEYYVAAQAVDLAGNKSALTERVKVSTGGNNAPVIKALSPVEFTLKPHETVAASFEIEEPDGHFYNIVLDPGSAGAVLDTLTREKPKVRIAGPNTPSGTYTAEMTVTDYYGLAAATKVKYTVLENHKPVLVKEMENRFYTSKASGTEEVDVADYFYDEDGEDLTYKFEFSNPDVANMTYSDRKFLITTMNYGTSEITVTGTDVRGESVSASFKVMVTDGSKELTCYPNPVKSVLNLRLGKECNSISVKVIAASGAVFFKGSFTGVTPFEPVKVDMSAASAGAYTVVVNADGKEIKSNIVKL